MSNKVVSITDKLNSWLTSDNFVIVLTSNTVVTNGTEPFNQTCGYSLGLNLQDIPDFIIFASAAISATTIKTVVDWVKEGGEIKLDTVYADLISEFPIVFKEVNSQKIDLLKIKQRHKTIQIVTPDSDQIFPWEEGYDPEHDKNQMLLF